MTPPEVAGRGAGPAGPTWQWAGRAAASVLFLTAGVVFALQVPVHPPGTGSRSCGSAWDVVAGRTGWQQWWSQDLADGSAPGGSLTRTLHCPAAVNRRIWISGGLGAAAVVVAAAGELAGSRQQRGARLRPRSQLRALSAVLIGVGCLLTVTGLAGVALLVANPDAELFLYVSRPVVALVGSLLVIPAVFIAALGMTARAALDEIERDRGGNEGR